MNKQQLANKIWSAANKMRSKIEANEYKDYILGFIFYRFLSEKEEKWLREKDFSEEDIKALSEEDEETKKYIQQNLGYFISYKYLFSTWLKQGQKFDISSVRDGLSAFERLISSKKQPKKVYSKIFNTLSTGLSKLGDSSGAQTKAVSSLLELIKDIPMDRQNYDVLGFIYEYLISMFAANAGKKAGEFYTPHEAATLMSEIVAEHLHDRDEVKIYDPTSGSGSLLITIGKAMSKYMDPAKIKYYAQELKENTYNLTRMNLVMRGIAADNIVVRNGDTLKDDWPYFDEEDKERTYEPLYVDAVVSNPPYSQSWNPANKATNPRFADYGLAPRGKADFAFLLHDLYHVRPDGIMAIVLPHGVLFRGNEEAEIRKKLIEKNKIDTIIGLPANAFFGTSIPTLIMVLKQKRDNTDVLIIDASQHYIKVDKKNKLQASDIRRIMDAIRQRKTIPGYCSLVSKETIRENGYKLNIPRYVDTAGKVESWDIYASMFGGIPKLEVAEFEEYWNAFPSLQEDLFKKTDTPYTSVETDDIGKTISINSDVLCFMKDYTESFSDFRKYLKKELLEDVEHVKIASEEEILSENIFMRLKSIPLVDKYRAYQLLDDNWQDMANDLEIIASEGLEVTRVVDPNMVIKKKDDKEVEVQDGWKGRILPFSLVQKRFFKAELEDIAQREQHLAELEQEVEESLESLEEDDREKITNDDGDKLDNQKLQAEVKRIMDEEIVSPEISELHAYIDILNNKATKTEKMAFVETHKDIYWSNIVPSKDGTYGKKAVNVYIGQLKKAYVFPEDSVMQTMLHIQEIIEAIKQVKTDIKSAKSELETKTKSYIEDMTEEEIYISLEDKWISPIVLGIADLPSEVLNKFTNEIEKMVEKYQETYQQVSQSIRVVEAEIGSMIDELDGNEYDLRGLHEFQSLLRGENNE